MKTTGTTVVQVLSGPTRQMLRRSMVLCEATDVRGFPSKGLTTSARLLYFRPTVTVDDRRTFQRLKLTKPILATAAGGNALVLDIGIAGAMLEHYGSPDPGDRFNLTFRWQGETVEFVCEVVRTSVVRTGSDGSSPVSHTGVKFIEAVGDSEERLQDLMATFVGRVLAAQKANAAGESRDVHPTILEQLGDARRSRTPGFVCYRLKGDIWWRIPTTSPAQPVDGFTVAASEDEEEIEALCETYAAADDEGRQLIRLVAELSARPKA